MLQELRIKDFAIIDEISLRLDAGFLVMTGETGAGKSIIVDAVNLLLGDRADATFVRAGAERALVEGTFRLSNEMQVALAPTLQAEGLEGESPDELILSREIRANGRSQARINGVMCRLAVYREIGGELVDIHGQSEHLSLLTPAQHLFLLDLFANADDLREQVRAQVSELARVRSQINALLSDEAALARRVDMLNYQIQEIDAAELTPGEEEELEQERNRLVNAEKIAALAAEAEFALLGDMGDSVGADGLIAQAALVLAKLAAIDSGMNESAALADTISVQVQELARSVSAYREESEFDPLRLDEIEERVEVLTRLKRKYGGTVEAVLAYGEKAREELENITNSEERLAQLREQEDDQLHQIGDLAGQLSALRQLAAQQLMQGIVSELGDLRMANARFEVRIEQTPDDGGCYVDEQRLAFSSTGVDKVEFFMAANIGEPLRPLAKVASGGETARIMLALKGVLSHADQVPTLIFDEVDQGIGGRLGSVLGQKLWRLSNQHQVLVVTHLAQLAGYADRHFRVSKHVEHNRTLTHAEPLDDHGRVEELAAMLGAETDSARQSAFDILMLARRVKEGRHLETA